uniref:Tripartite motif-containing protein 16-like n=1 Tax=Erpetoichthys calabaricus TaxID=27687 RepID=A0A8C4RP05_ERPCA
MAEAQLCGLQDGFTCSVCLDTLTDPVSLHCGHSSCLKCLTNYWDWSQVCSCPQCRHTFMLRPELKRNTLLNEVIRKLKKTTLSLPPSQNYAGPGDVECDFCNGKKFRAVKSCLTCVASYCQTHLQPHYEGEAWKGHKLVDPVRNLKEKLREKHQKSLEIYCKTDDSCICMMCVVTGHNEHKVVELETEREEKQVSTEDKLKSSRQIRNIRKILNSTLNQQTLDDESLQTVTCEVESIINNRPLTKTSDDPNDLEPLTPNHLLLLKTQPDMPPGLFSTNDQNTQRHWKQIQYTADLFWTRWSKDPVTHSQIFSLVFFSLLSDFCPLTLDINTAHRDLRLSEGNKKVTFLCKEAVTGTRCYWEVDCSGLFMIIGIAYKGLSRKGRSVECILGRNDKSWYLQCSYSQYFVCHNTKDNVISAPFSPRIGVYLDWPAGSLSFYSVSHTMTLLHRFNTSFTEPLYPGFGFYFGLKCSVTIIPLTSYLMSPQVQILFVMRGERGCQGLHYYWVGVANQVCVS